MFSDVDIKQQLQERKKNSERGILIEPFEDKYLTPVGYDLRVGKKGFSWNSKEEVDIEGKRRIEIKPNDTIVIETLESVSLSKEVGATIHSMATRVITQGLSQISTTIDPGWTGRLLISFHNYRDSSVELRLGDSFCTICFYRVESKSKVSLGRPPDRDDLWQQLIEISRQEKKKKEEENRRRNFGRWAFIAIGLLVGVIISIRKPDIGASVATFLAVFSPLVYDNLKPR